MIRSALLSGVVSVSLLVCPSAVQGQEVLRYDPSQKEYGSYELGWRSIWLSREQAWRVESLHGSKHLAHRSDLSGPRALVYEAAGKVENGEIVARMMRTATDATQNRLLVRARGERGRETAYQFDVRSSVVRLSRYRDGSFSALATHEFDAGTHQWNWVRLRVEGNRLLARVWRDGDPEPEGWTLEVEDEAITGPGYVGIGSYSLSGTRYYDNISIATGGASAEIVALPESIQQVRIVHHGAVIGHAGPAGNVAGGLEGRGLRIPAGTSRGGVAVSFHASDGRAFPVPESGRVEIQVEDETIAEFQHPGAGALKADFHGHRAGMTKAWVRYGDDHGRTFTSQPITIQVLSNEGDRRWVEEHSPFPWASPESARMSSEGLEEMDRTLRRWVETDEIVGGVMMVVRDGSLVHFETAGWADREQSIPMRADQIFQMRSMTKKILGTAILQLMERGKLSPWDRVADYLEGWDTDASREVTVHQLLAHTGGAQGPINHGADNIIDAANEIGAHGPAFEPGTQYSYSDPGSTTLGGLVAMLSGHTGCEPHMHHYIFKPLRMHDTFCNMVPEGDVRAGRVLARYSGGKGSWSKYSEMGQLESNDWCRASGGVYSTILDWSRYMAAMLNEGQFQGVRILEKESVELATRPHSAEAYSDEERAARTDFYGYHFAVESDVFGGDPSPRSPRYFGHGGSDGTFAFVDPEYDLMALFFTQSRRHRQSGEDSRERFIDMVYEAMVENRVR